MLVYSLMETEAHQAALAFLRANPMTHVATVDGALPQVRVMRVARVDDDFTLWYCTFAASNKVRQLALNPAVSISICDGAQDLRLAGSAQIVRDAEIRHALWQPAWLRYFPLGADDPQYVVMQVSVTNVVFEHTPAA
jgi:general stress protein 26